MSASPTEDPQGRCDPGSRRPEEDDLTVTFYPRRLEQRSRPRQLSPSQAVRLAGQPPAVPEDDEARRYTPAQPPADHLRLPPPPAARRTAVAHAAAVPPVRPTAPAPGPRVGRHRRPASGGSWLARLLRRLLG